MNINEAREIISRFEFNSPIPFVFSIEELWSSYDYVELRITMKTIDKKTREAISVHISRLIHLSTVNARTFGAMVIALANEIWEYEFKEWFLFEGHYVLSPRAEYQEKVL